MTTIYRRVPVHDTPTEKGRLPDKEGFYGIIVNPTLNSIPIFTTSWFNGQKFTDAPCLFWLEPVDLPTEEEIENEYPPTRGKVSGSYRIGAREGAKWVIDFINKK